MLNPVLKAVLVRTRDAILVEASLRDEFWGVGMAIDNDLVRFPMLWRGQNMLGQILIEIRQIFVNEFVMFHTSQIHTSQ